MKPPNLTHKQFQQILDGNGDVITLNSFGNNMVNQ